MVDVKDGDLTLHKTSSSAAARKAAAQTKQPIQQQKSVGFGLGDLVEVMKHHGNANNSRKTLQPQVKDLLQGLFLKKTANNPIYKLSDFKRIKMGEKEFKKIERAKTMELGKSLQARDPALEALHLMDPTFLRGLTSNQFHKMLADTETNHNLAYKL